MRLNCCFIDNTQNRRETFLAIKEEMIMQLKDYDIKGALGSSVRNGYTVENIKTHLLATEKGQDAYFWIIDIHMADYADMAKALNADPALRNYQLLDLADEDASQDYLLFRYLKNFLERNRILTFYISSHDEEYLRKEGLLRKDEQLLEFPQAKQSPFDLGHNEAVLQTAKALLTQVKQRFPLNGNRTGSVGGSARAMLAHIFKHKEQNHLEEHREWLILDGVAQYLHYRDWKDLAERLDMFTSIGERHDPRDLMAETVKGLSEGRLTLSGLLLLIWGVVRDHELNAKLDNSAAISQGIEAFFVEQTKSWHSRPPGDSSLHALESFARYQSFFVPRSTEAQFINYNATLVEFFSKLLKPRDFPKNRTIQLKVVDPKVLEAKLELVLHKVDPKLIAALNSSSAKLLGKDTKVGSTAEKFLQWNLGRSIGFLTPSELTSNKSAGESEKWHHKYSKTNFGARGSVLFEYDKTNNHTHLIFRL